jgi:hypothetical protein
MTKREPPRDRPRVPSDHTDTRDPDRPGDPPRSQARGLIVALDEVLDPPPAQRPHESRVAPRTSSARRARRIRSRRRSMDPTRPPRRRSTRRSSSRSCPAPNAGATGTDQTDGNGEATFTYTAAQGLAGLDADAIQACSTARDPKGERRAPRSPSSGATRRRPRPHASPPPTRRAGTSRRRATTPPAARTRTASTSRPRPTLSTRTQRSSTTARARPPSARSLRG